MCPFLGHALVCDSVVSDRPLYVDIDTGGTSLASHLADIMPEGVAWGDAGDANFSIEEGGSTAFMPGNDEEDPEVQAADWGVAQGICISCDISQADGRSGVAFHVVDEHNYWRAYVDASTELLYVELVCDGEVTQQFTASLNDPGSHRLSVTLTSTGANTHIHVEVASLNDTPTANLDIDDGTFASATAHGLYKRAGIRNTVLHDNFSVTTLHQPVSGTSNGITVYVPSDRRLKENIVRVGEERGIPLYEFTYRGDAVRYRGVMAQDLLESHPEAVAMMANGFYAVNYAKLGMQCRKVGPS